MLLRLGFVRMADLFYFFTQQQKSFGTNDKARLRAMSMGCFCLPFAKAKPRPAIKISHVMNNETSSKMGFAYNYGS